MSRTNKRHPRTGLTGPRIVAVRAHGLATLLCTTALQLGLVTSIALPARAQPPANAQPQGGQVTAGSASIAQSAAGTTINQASQRAAINWNSYNIGRNQSVTYNQPGSSAITLNRVTGPDPSLIAGSIHANGQVVITNQSGVVFFKGSQVDAQSLVVSAAGISNQNFMAGRMVFDQAPNPNAAIVNAGTLTMAQAGIAALVAPRVANSGVITAQLGHVVLAGAQTHVLDMYGDGLVSIDVTRQVTQAPVGRNGKPVAALVTNSGTIIADGGTVQLTASAADGVVQTLVDAGGTIRANSTPGHTGIIAVNGTGGSISIDGSLLAEGRVAGTTGGQIALNATETVAVGAKAVISASGAAGGGTVAVGTTLARAKGGPSVTAPMAKRTIVAKGATISADATVSGQGGTITLLSSGLTVHDGSISAQGGPLGGDGGFVELSGYTLQLDGPVSTAAPAGKLGNILLDPEDLTITEGGTPVTPGNGNPNIGFGDGGTSTDSTVTPEELALLTGNIHLQAARNLIVASSFTNLGGGVTLEAGANLTVDNGVTITAGTPNPTGGSDGNIILSAAVDFGNGTIVVPGFDPAGSITMLGSLQAPNGFVTLNAGTGGITIGGNINAAFGLDIESAGGVTQTGGAITTAFLSGNAGGTTSLTSATNAITTVGNFTVTNGDFLLTDSAPLTIGATGTISARSLGHNIVITDDNLIFGNSQGTIVAGSLAVSATGTIVLDTLTPGATIQLLGFETVTPDPNATLVITQADVDSMTGGTLQLGNVNAGPIIIGGPNDFVAVDDSFSALSLVSTGAITEGAGAQLEVATLEGRAVTANLPGFNFIDTLGSFTTQNGFTLTNAAPLTVTGPVTDGSAVSITTEGALTMAGNVTAPTIDLIAMNLQEEEEGDGDGLLGTIVQTAGTIDGSGTVFLQADSGITQTGGAIIGGTLTGSSGDITSLTSASNQIAALGSFSSVGGFTLNNATSYAVTGPVTDTASITLEGAADLTLAGNLTAPEVLLIVSGAVTQPGGIITAAELDGGVGSLSLTQANAIGTIGSFSSFGDWSVSDGIPVTVAGTIQAGTGHTLTLTDDLIEFGPQALVEAPSGTIALAPLTPGVAMTIGDATGIPAGSPPFIANTLQLGSATAGPITIDGVLDLTGVNALDLVSASTVTEGANGGLVVGTLMGDVGSATLTGANTIGALGSFTAAGTLTLGDSVALTVAGPVSTGNLTLIDPGAITFTGDVTTGVLTITAGGEVVQTTGILTASLLTGSAVGRAQFGPDDPTPIANIGTLGDFSVTGGTLSLADNQALTIQGTISAGNILISAPDQIHLEGGAIVTNGAAVGAQLGTAPAASGSSITVTGAGGRLTQDGTTTVTALGSGSVTLRLQATGGISLNNLAGPGAALILASAGGLTGNIDVASLNVLGQTGFATLFGTVGGIGGGTAASVAMISPKINTKYLLNGCVIASSTCAVANTSIPTLAFLLLSPVSSRITIPDLPLLPPVSFPLNLADPDIMLPNISSQDY